MSWLTLFTSLPPRLDRETADGAQVGPTYQRLCLVSWRRLGARVVSLNFADEIDALSRAHPDVDFVAVPENRDGAKLVPLDQVLAAVAAADTAHVGLINADILLKPAYPFRDWVEAMAAGELGLSRRVHIDSLKTIAGQPDPYGFDLMVARPDTLAGLPPGPFRLGMPWWDYWLPLSVAATGCRLRALPQPTIYHLKHKLNWSQASYQDGAREAQASLTATAQAHAGPQAEAILAMLIEHAKSVYAQPLSVQAVIFDEMVVALINRFLQDAA